MNDLEIKAFAEGTKLFNIESGEWRDAIVVRVRYRKPPTRRWSKFTIVPQEGRRRQSIEELLESERIRSAIEWHQKEGDR